MKTKFKLTIELDFADMFEAEKESGDILVNEFETVEELIQHLKDAHDIETDEEFEEFLSSDGREMLLNSDWEGRDYLGSILNF